MLQCTRGDQKNSVEMVLLIYLLQLQWIRFWLPGLYDKSLHTLSHVIMHSCFLIHKFPTGKETETLHYRR